MKPKINRKMEKSAYKQGTLLFIAAVLLSLTVSGQEVSKDYHKEYKADMNTTIDLKNRYGDVVITGTDGNQVIIDVKVTVKHPDESKAKKFLDMIEVQFTEAPNLITAKTIISEGFNFGWGVNREFKINWTVKMPYSSNLTLANSYGNTDINELRGKVSLDVMYGNTEIDKLTRGNEKPVNRIALSYGKATILEAGWLDLYLRYAGINIEESQALLVDSRYSKMRFVKTSSVVAEAKYDNYSMDKINNLVLVSGYTDVTIAELSKKLNFDATFGSLSVEQVPAGFESLDVNVKYTGVRLGINESASYKLEGRSSYGGIKFNDANFNYRKKIIENTSSEIEGVIGKDESTASMVKVATEYGTVKLY
jgi:hypothetical protein